MKSTDCGFEHEGGRGKKNEPANKGTSRKGSRGGKGDRKTRQRNVGPKSQKDVPRDAANNRLLEL